VSEAGDGLKLEEPQLEADQPSRGNLTGKCLLLVHDTVTVATPRLVGINLKPIPATTDIRKAAMKRTDEKDSPIASDACNSQFITKIALDEPNNAVVLAMIQQLGCPEQWDTARACPACKYGLNCGSTDQAPVKTLTGNMATCVVQTAKTAT